MKFLGLHNFRIFNNSTVLDFAPITILTGPNNSGKSSILKALLLLKENLKPNAHLTMDIEKLNFLNGSHKLGSFDSCINKDGDKDHIAFALPFNLISSTDTIILSYTRIDNKINNGHLKDITILSSGGKETLLKVTEFIDGNGFQYYVNFDLLHKHFSEKTKKEEQHSNTTIVWGGMTLKEFRKDEDPVKKYFTPEKPLFDYFVSNANSKISSNFENIDYAYLKNISSKESILYHPENESNLLEALIYEINIKYKGDGLTSNNHLYFLKEKYSLDKIKSCENGMLFFELICQRINLGFKKLFLSIQNLNYLNTDKVDQRRIYYDNQNTIFTDLIIQYNETFGNDDHTFLNKWLYEFGIIKENETIHFERIANSAFEIKIINLNNNEHLGINIADLGFGVTQLIALLLRFSTDSGRVYLIEEPETNLHPNFQSKLADLFVDVMKNYKARFIIETHSEYLIRKLQYLVATSYATMKKKSSLSLLPHQVKLYYFKEPINNSGKLEKIEIKRDGRLSQDFGTGFLDESTKIIFDIWNLPGQN